MDQETLMDTIRSASVDNRLTCEAAHELSEKLHVSLQEIGAVCNELKIKVAQCQLGCF